MNMTVRCRWHVIPFDLYPEHYEQWVEPLILDADDLIYNRAALVKFCRRTGLDPARTKYSWPTTEVVITYKQEDVFVDTLAASETILPGKCSAGPDLEAESKKWLSEFGEQEGELLIKWVRNAMPDYTYLREQSIGAML